MTHLDFINKLISLGCHPISTNKLGETKTIEINNQLTDTTIIEIKDFQIKYKNKSLFTQEPPINHLIRKAIDIGEWKFSWHNKISSENYDKIIEILQELIIERVKQIELLMTAYTQVQYELSKSKS